MEILSGIYWISLFLLVYPYLIYPILLIVLAKFFASNNNLKKLEHRWPTVTFFISAYNEEVVIEQKLNNTLALDYPDEKLEIMVISDASSDRTDEIVREWALKHPNIKLIRQAERRGKSAGLNLGVREARGEIFIFSDANAMYQKNAVYELVKYFDNADIGYVIGAALYNTNKDSMATESESLYWKFELFVKEWESKFYSVVVGDGAIYAIRNHLYWDLEEDDINDFVNPLQIVARGYKGLINQQAICYEDAGSDFRKEFRRKRRIVNRSWRAVKKYIGWFNLKSHKRFLFELFSHKVIRWFSLVILFIMFVANLLLVAFSPGLFYVITLVGQIVLGVLALIGFLLDGRNKVIPRIIYLPYYYYVVNTAALLGIIDEFRGIKHTVWEHIRNE